LKPIPDQKKGGPEGPPSIRITLFSEGEADIRNRELTKVPNARL